MIIELDRKCGLPPAVQIADAIALRILEGAVGPGQPLPSVRDLALQLHVNPRTVRSAYERLREEGLLAGPDNAPLVAASSSASQELRTALLGRLAHRLVAHARRLQVSPTVLSELFEQALGGPHESDC